MVVHKKLLEPKYKLSSSKVVFSYKVKSAFVTVTVSPLKHSKYGKLINHQYFQYFQLTVIMGVHFNMKFLRGNVRTMSMARWKVHTRLPIRDNGTFFR